MTPEDLAIERAYMQVASWLVYVSAMASDYRKLKRPLSAEERAELVILVDEMKILEAALRGERDAPLGH